MIISSIAARKNDYDKGGTSSLRSLFDGLPMKTASKGIVVVTPGGRRSFGFVSISPETWLLSSLGEEKA